MTYVIITHTFMAVERQTPRDQAVSIRLRPVAINTPEGKINGTALKLGGAFPPTTIFDFPTLNVIHVRRKAENSGLAMVLHGTTNGFRKGLEASQNTAAVKLSEKDGKRSFIRISD